jgi:hypothetical protein
MTSPHDLAPPRPSRLSTPRPHPKGGEVGSYLAPTSPRAASRATVEHADEGTTRHVDFNVLPADLAALYSGAREPEQLAPPLDDAATEFKRWLEAQPLPEWMDAA